MTDRAGLIERFAEVVDCAKQYRQSWRDCIDRTDALAFDRDNSDESDHNLQAFDAVMDFVEALTTHVAVMERVKEALELSQKIIEHTSGSGAWRNSFLREDVLPKLRQALSALKELEQSK